MLRPKWFFYGMGKYLQKIIEKIVGGKFKQISTLRLLPQQRIKNNLAHFWQMIVYLVRKSP